jgi:hypothetical protein
MSITLDEDEIKAITGYDRGAEQLRELRAQGFYRARRNYLGQIVLERGHYEAVCAGRDQAAQETGRQPRLHAA